MAKTHEEHNRSEWYISRHIGPASQTQWHNHQRAPLSGLEMEMSTPSMLSSWAQQFTFTLPVGYLYLTCGMTAWDQDQLWTEHLHRRLDYIYLLHLNPATIDARQLSGTEL